MTKMKSALRIVSILFLVLAALLTIIGGLFFLQNWSGGAALLTGAAFTWLVTGIFVWIGLRAGNIESSGLTYLPLILLLPLAGFLSVYSFIFYTENWSGWWMMLIGALVTWTASILLLLKIRSTDTISLPEDHVDLG